MKIVTVGLFAVLFFLGGTDLYSEPLPTKDRSGYSKTGGKAEEGIILVHGGIGHDLPELSGQSTPDERSARNPDIVMPQKGIPAPGQAPSPAVEPGDSFRPGPSPAMQNPQMKNLPRGQRSQDLGGVIPPDMDDKNR
jgi:hypothetical protein